MQAGLLCWCVKSSWPCLLLAGFSMLIACNRLLACAGSYGFAAAGRVHCSLVWLWCWISLAQSSLRGLVKPRSPKRIATNRLERRLLEIDKLDAKAKRQITQLLDSFIEGQKLKQRLAQRS